MDKYQGMYRVDVKLTDNSDYSYYKHTKKGVANNFDGVATKARNEFTNNYYESENTIDNALSVNSIQTASISSIDSIIQEQDMLPLYITREDNGYPRKEGGVIAYSPIGQRKKKKRNGFLIRLMVSSILFFCVFAVNNIDNAHCQKAANYVKDAIAYDYDAKEDKRLGEITAVSLIEELNEDNSEEQ